ncbi:MAG: glycosyltransferase family 2 protein [Anaerohalosphaeraceae bacterium]|nr:glycosyltransferase family 2 protein [Anaerohalosphaeraceae bacterium]
MKLIIQIPCYNEQETLPAVIADLPRQIDGVDEIEYMIIDDGSNDKTVDVAKELGVNHIVELGSNHGLATAFKRGIQSCLGAGADIIVNTDGDNQYKAEYIKDLIRPIIDNTADVVIGARPIENIEHFSLIKKKLQRLGSGFVRRFSGTNVSDTTSGFRAYSARAASQLQVFNRYTYTLETIIQAGAMDMRIASVPIDVNDKTRESRLFKSIPGYIWRSGCVIIRSYVIYKPFMTFLYPSIITGLLGLIPCLRFLYFYFTQGTSGHIQSLLFGVVLLMISFNLFSLGIIGHIIGSNRKLINQLTSQTLIDKRK